MYHQLSTSYLRPVFPDPEPIGTVQERSRVFGYLVANVVFSQFAFGVALRAANTSLASTIDCAEYHRLCRAMYQPIAVVALR